MSNVHGQEVLLTMVYEQKEEGLFWRVGVEFDGEPTYEAVGPTMDMAWQALVRDMVEELYIPWKDYRS